MNNKYFYIRYGSIVKFKQAGFCPAGLAEATLQSEYNRNMRTCWELEKRRIEEQNELRKLDNYLYDKAKELAMAQLPQRPEGNAHKTSVKKWRAKLAFKIQFILEDLRFNAGIRYLEYCKYERI